MNLVDYPSPKSTDRKGLESSMRIRSLEISNLHLVNLVIQIYYGKQLQQVQVDKV